MLLSLLLRSQNGAPLTAVQHDNNLTAIENAVNAKAITFIANPVNSYTNANFGANATSFNQQIILNDAILQGKGAALIAFFGGINTLTGAAVGDEIQLEIDFYKEATEVNFMTYAITRYTVFQTTPALKTIPSVSNGAAPNLVWAPIVNNQIVSHVFKLLPATITGNSTQVNIQIWAVTDGATSP